MPYERRVDREHPACFMFLLDQSYSMNEPVAGRTNQAKATALAAAINNMLYELVLRCIKNPDQGPRHYYDVGVVGYGASVGPVWSGPLTGRDLVSVVDIAHYPLRVEQRDQSTVGGNARTPIWFDPVADGATPMSAAMDLAGRFIAGWIRAHPSSFPPIVINVSDGAATDGDPMVWAKRLKSLATDDGNVLVFNVSISALDGRLVWFPSSDEGLDDDYARQMFAMSSELPGFMQEVAMMRGHRVQPGARGFVFNADILSVANFLQIGTATHHLGV